MNELRLLLAAATGAVIGIFVVVALAWSLRLISRRQHAGTGADQPARPPIRLPLWVKAAIIVAAMIGYGVIGYTYQGAVPPPDASPPPQAEQGGPAADAAASITIGGVALSFAPPAGYCLYPEPLLQSVIANQAKVNPDNVVHAVFGSCDQLRDAAANPARVRDFGMLMTPKAQLEQNFDQAALDRVVASAMDPATVKQTLDQRLKDAQSRLKLQSFSSLGVLDREQGTAYFAYLFQSSTQNENFAQACIMAMTTLKGRLVSYYLYSDYSKDARTALIALLQKVKAGIGDFAARNR
jgi:hypothetical protein